MSHTTTEPLKEKIEKIISTWEEQKRMLESHGAGNTTWLDYCINDLKDALGQPTSDTPICDAEVYTDKDDDQVIPYALGQKLERELAKLKSDLRLTQDHLQHVEEGGA